MTFQKTMAGLKTLRPPAWWLQSIGLPFLMTRLVFVTLNLLLYADHTIPIYEAANHQDFWMINNPWLDMFFRWDSSWYMMIIQKGYFLNGTLGVQENNAVFFPLLPLLTRLGTFFLPARMVPLAVYMAVGVFIVNLSFLGALTLLYRLAAEWYDTATAARSIRFALAYPLGFIFSCFYPESIFLLTALGAVYLAVGRDVRGWLLQHRWAMAGTLAALTALSRPQGVLMMPLLGLLYAQRHNWNLRELRADVLWLGLPALAMAGFFAALYPVTGSWTAPLTAQAAWNNIQVNSTLVMIKSFADPASYISFNFMLPLGATILSLIAIFALPNPGYGVFSLLMIAMVFSKGNFASAGRYVASIFPIYWTAAKVFRHASLEITVLAVFYILQIVLIVGWSKMYFIV